MQDTLMHLRRCERADQTGKVSGMLADARTALDAVDECRNSIDSVIGEQRAKERGAAS